MQKLSTNLSKLIEVEEDARAFGFDWPNKELIIDQAISECEEIKDAISGHESQERVQEEIGDLLHTAVSLCIFSGFNVEETIAKVNEKFGRRMSILKTIALEHGLKNLQGQSIEFMLELWDEVKIREK